MRAKKRQRKPEKCYHLVWVQAVTPGYETCTDCGLIRKVEKAEKQPTK